MYPQGWKVPEFNPLKRNPSSSGLHKAAASGDVDTIKRALEKDDKSNKKKSGKTRTVDTRDEEGWQLLHSSAASGHEEVVKLLVEHGADVNMLAIIYRKADQSKQFANQPLYPRKATPPLSINTIHRIESCQPNK